MSYSELDKFEKEIDELYDEQARKIFEHIEKIGDKAFAKNSPLYKYKDTTLLERLIKHFEEFEEYEKCAKLKSVQEGLDRSKFY